MLQSINIVGNGFNVLKDYNSWRIAMIGYDEYINSLNGIKTLGRHFETDEAFVLLEGTSYMLTAGLDDDPNYIEVEKLEEGKLYVVKEKQWHVAVLEPMSILLVVENEDTGILNTENYTLTKSDMEFIESKFKNIRS